MENVWAFYRRSTDKQELVFKGGHVSVVAGGNAVKRLWPRLDAWLGERSI